MALKLPPQSPRYEDNLARHAVGDAPPCVLCGKPTPAPAGSVWLHLGGGAVVTEEEGEELNRTEARAGDCGWHPIGRSCLRRYPELRPFVF